MLLIPTSQDNPLLRAIREAVGLSSAGTPIETNSEARTSANTEANRCHADIARALEKAGSCCGYLVFNVN